MGIVNSLHNSGNVLNKIINLKSTYMKKISLITGLSALMIVFIASCNKSNENEPVTNYQSYGGHRYAITSNKLNWDEAKQFALEQGGYLVVINSQAENDFIRDTYRIPLKGTDDILWIGLSDAEEEGIFRWVNGEIPTFTNWALYEPNNDYGTQDYGHMYLDGTWDDVEVKDCYAIIEFDN